eukprot:CAMPEP_0170624360 /NCGR_PEP_ID=MMETSP0224-20130122/30191_1 /TAXON_ID=285029 /ORGANISM="Togula jolla, Strain CCCM 725" /LENGTH=221 /DNA_ID=CAMNT_0010950877 /DNA_START=75 /DNA_END=740 /DNA_ORIENTATION=-
MAYADDMKAVKANTTSCCGCYLAECSMSSEPCNPGIVGIAKFCCCSLGYKGDNDVCCKEDKGCLGVFVKLCCCIPYASMKHMSIGCCDQFVCGTGPMGENKPVVDEDLDFMQHVFWCAYCLVVGIGCAPPTDPIVWGNAQVCCVEAKLGTNNMSDEELGVISIHKKCCCAVAEIELPPTNNIGCTVCCARVAGGADAREVDGDGMALYMRAPEEKPHQQCM